MTIGAGAIQNCLNVFGNSGRRLQSFALNDWRIGKIGTEKLQNYKNRK